MLLHLSSSMLTMITLSLGLFLLTFTVRTVDCQADLRDGLSTESRLAADLLGNYRVYNTNFMRPVKNSSQPVLVSFGVSLIQVLEFNEKEQTLVTLLWKTYSWKDEYLSWDPTQYGNLTTILLSHNRIWSPDIVLYNNVGKPSAEEHKSLVSVNSSGYTTWSPAVLYRSSCSLFMKNFPFDEQRCVLRFGPWSHSVDKVDMQFLGGKKGFEFGDYTMNSGWEVIEHGATRRVRSYPCCQDRFVDMEFFLQVRRRVTFHIRLILVPTILLSVMSCAIFWIPHTRPDRTTLGLGLFSAFFLLLISVLNNSPPTTHSKLGAYFIIVILMVCFGILFTVIVVNIGQTNRRVPFIVEKILVFFNCITCQCQRSQGPSNNVTLPLVDAVANPLGPSTQLHVQPTSGAAVDAAKATLYDRKKWQDFALILDRVVFIIFFTCILVTFMLVFPLPENIFSADE